MVGFSYIYGAKFISPCAGRYLRVPQFINSKIWRISNRPRQKEFRYLIILDKEIFIPRVRDISIRDQVHKEIPQNVLSVDINWY